MKMFMPLLSPAAGTLHHVLPEGSLLNAGDLIARHAQDSRCIAIASMPAVLLYRAVNEPLVPCA